MPGVGIGAGPPGLSPDWDTSLGEPLCPCSLLGMGGGSAACLSQGPWEPQAHGKVLSKHSGPQLTEMHGEGR